MPALDLSFDAVLTTTRSVRKRLDLSCPVEPEVLRECLELALQSPTASNMQNWHFIVVTDREQRQALATIYRKGMTSYREQAAALGQQRMASNEQEATAHARIIDSTEYLNEHLHEVPVHVIPCIQGRTDQEPIIVQSAQWGTIMPAVWSFMLAARSRGLGTSLTSFHLAFEHEAAEVLGIPYEQVMQAALVPVAYTLGTDFQPAARKPAESVLHWEHW
jgi:nitroreductase